MPWALRPTPNPLARRLIRRAGCLASPPAVWAAVLLSVLSAYTYWNAVNSPLGAGFWVRASILSYLGMIVVPVSLPIFLSILAANLPAGYLRSRELELVCTTTLTNLEMVQVYVYAALYRARAIAASTLVMLPFMSFLFLNQANRPGWPGAPPPMYPDWYVLFQAVAFTVGLLGFSLLVTSLGVGLFLWWRQTLLAGLAALFVPALAAWQIVAIINDLTRFLGLERSVLWGAGWRALLALLPFALARWLIREAAIYVRRDPDVPEKGW